MSLQKTLYSNAVEGAKILSQYLKGERQGGDIIKVSCIAVAQFNRFAATSGAFIGLKYAALRDTAKNRKELKELIRVHTPEIFEKKQLE